MWSQSPSECTSEYEATGIQQDEKNEWKEKLYGTTSYAALEIWNQTSTQTYTSNQTSNQISASTSPNETESTRWVSTQNVSTSLLSPIHITYHRASLPIISYPTPSPVPVPLPPSSPSPCSPIHRPTRTRSTSAPSPTRFTFTSSHIASSQRHTLITTLRHPAHVQEPSWYGDLTRYPVAPIQLNLEKRWSASTPTIMSSATTTITTTTTTTSPPTAKLKALPSPPIPPSAIPSSIELIPTPTPTPTPISVSTPTTILIPSAPSLSSHSSYHSHITSTSHEFASPRDMITPTTESHWQLSPSSSSSPSTSVPQYPSVSIRIPSTPTSSLSSSSSSSSSITQCLNMWHAHSLHATPLHVHHQRSTSIVSSH